MIFSFSGIAETHIGRLSLAGEDYGQRVNELDEGHLTAV